MAGHDRHYPPAIGWSVIGLCFLVGPILITIGVRKNDKKSPNDDGYIKQKWEHYNKLTDLIMSTEDAPHEKWSEVVANMQRELKAIGDKTISRYMRLYFPVLDEAEYVGIKPSRAVSQKIIDLTREHMIRKYRRY